MKFSELKKGITVEDRWYPDWGYGKVLKVLKTRAKIDFRYLEGITTFDKSCVQFLEIVKSK